MNFIKIVCETFLGGLIILIILFLVSLSVDRGALVPICVVVGSAAAWVIGWGLGKLFKMWEN